MRGASICQFLYTLGLSMLFCVVMGASLALAQEDARAPMSVQDVLKYTHSNNPSLLAARSALRATKERLPQAYAGWRPNLSSEFTMTDTDIDGGSAGGSTSKEIGVSLDQSLYKGGSIFAQVAAAKHVIAAQEADLHAQEQDVLVLALTAYMDVLRDEALFNLNKNNYKVLGQQYEAAKLRFEVGELTRTDVSQSRARLARAKSDMIRAQGDLKSAQALFEEIVGLEAGVLSYPDIPVSMPSSAEEAAEMAEGLNPDVVAAIAAHKAAEEDVDNVFGELLPQIGVFGTWNKAYDPSPGLTDEQTTRAIGLSASIPLYQGGATRSRVRQAKYTANELYMRIMDVRRAARQRAISAWTQWQSAREEIKARSAQVAASKIAQEGVEQETLYGARSVLDSLDADQELLDARVALVSAKRDEIVAKFSLLAALGRANSEALSLRPVFMLDGAEGEK